MNYNTLFAAALAALACALLTVPVRADAQTQAASWPASGQGMESRVYPLTVAPGQATPLTANYLETRLGMEEGTLTGATVAALPPREQGTLLLDGVAVDRYETLTRAQLDRLCYLPGEGAQDGYLSLIPAGGLPVCATLALEVSPQNNTPPSLQNGVLRTAKNLSATVELGWEDADGDRMTLQLGQKPKKGTVRFEENRCIYTPYPNSAGRDRFTVVAADSRGALSNQAVVQVEIDRRQPQTEYLDLKGHPCEYAAVMLRQAGILTGEETGQTAMFHPQREMDRGQFLAAALQAAGLAEEVSACVNTGLPNDGDLPLWLKPYVKLALERGVLPQGERFYHNLPPTQREAAGLIQAVAGCAGSAQVWSPADGGVTLATPQLTAADGAACLTGEGFLPAQSAGEEPLTRGAAAQLLWALATL